MNVSPHQSHEIDTDVLVVGCGMGGARAALRAAELGADVTLIEKAAIGRAGPMTYVHTQYAPPRLIEEPELHDWIAEMVDSSNHIVDQDAVRMLVHDAYHRMQELIALGLPFARDTTGALKYFVLRGHRVGTCLAADGRACMDVLHRLMRQQRARLRIVEKIQVLELLTSDGERPTRGRVVGVVGVNTLTGAPVVVRAKHVILNTGPVYPKMRYCFADHCTGEGHAMAYRAGARLTGMEFLTFCGWGIFNKAGDPGRHFATGGQAKLQKIGHFINARGERFMDRYDRVWGEQTGLVQMARGIISETLEGRGPCYLDLRGASDEDLAHLYEAVPSVGRSFKEFGLDPRQDLLQLNPVVAIGSQSSGGVEVGLEDAQSSVPGLYAVGYCSHNPHMMSGISVPITTWSNIGGYRAGEAAARARADTPAPRVHAHQVQQALDAFFAPSRRVRQVRPGQVWAAIQDVIADPPFALFKTEKRILAARDRLLDIEEGLLARAYAPDIHELVKIAEARGYIQAAALACTAMAVRRESRGELFRIDHPYQDNDHWLRWVRLQRTSAAMAPEVSFRELPVERWPVAVPRGRFPVDYPVPERFREQEAAA